MRALAAILAAYVVALLTLTHLAFRYHNEVLFAVTAACYLVAVLLVSRLRSNSKTVGFVIIAVGAILQIAALTHAPLTSDDAYRYAWDAKVQLAGIDPYRYAPAAHALAAVRDGFFFGPHSACAHPLPHGCTSINRPAVHTIYPPVAQAVFVLARVASVGGMGGLFVFQLLAAIGATAVSVLIVRSLMHSSRPVWPAALWSWCPVVVLEFGQNAHIDWLAILFLVLALGAARNGKRALAGGLLGAAIATKIYPILVLPALIRRRPILVTACAAVVVIVGYVPHVMAVGGAVLGYLPGYLHEEGYASGTRLLLLGLVLPDHIDVVVGAALLLGVVIVASRRLRAYPPEHLATVIVGATFLVTTPSYGWYAAVLVALAAFSARYEWIVLALAPPIVYLIRIDISQRVWASVIPYAIAAVGTFVVWRARTRLPRPSDLGALDSPSQVVHA